MKFVFMCQKVLNDKFTVQFQVVVLKVNLGCADCLWRVYRIVSKINGKFSSVCLFLFVL